MLPVTPTAEMTRSHGERLDAALAVVDGGGDAVAFLSSFVTLAPVRILMPCFSNALRAKRGDFGVLDWQNLRQHFDHRHVRAPSYG